MLEDLKFVTEFLDRSINYSKISKEGNGTKVTFERRGPTYMLQLQQNKAVQRVHPMKATTPSKERLKLGRPSKIFVNPQKKAKLSEEWRRPFRRNAQSAEITLADEQQPDMELDGSTIRRMCRKAKGLKVKFFLRRIFVNLLRQEDELVKDLRYTDQVLKLGLSTPQNLTLIDEMY